MFFKVTALAPIIHMYFNTFMEFISQGKLVSNNELVPTVKSGESFKYLGRYFNFEMDNEAHKEKLALSLRFLCVLMIFLSYLKHSSSLSAFHPFKIILALHSSIIVKNMGNSKSWYRCN